MSPSLLSSTIWGTFDRQQGTQRPLGRASFTQRLPLLSRSAARLGKAVGEHSAARPPAPGLWDAWPVRDEKRTPRLPPAPVVHSRPRRSVPGRKTWSYPTGAGPPPTADDALWKKKTKPITLAKTKSNISDGWIYLILEITISHERQDECVVKLSITISGNEDEQGVSAE